MNRLKKHIISFSLCISILGVFIFTNTVSASDVEHDCSSCHMSMYDINATDNVEREWEREVVVELGSEEEFYSYSINPNYRYTFVWTEPSLTRAVCYNCGKSTMGLINRKIQYAGDDRMCPIAPAALYNDYFATWHTYTYERCTACAYESEGFNLRITYSAFCCNDDNPIDGSMWDVRFEYTIGGGYNPHQCLSWWLYYNFL